jgi:ubiquinone/menaquinone biosynthesis C-methylase UbiE
MFTKMNVVHILGLRPRRADPMHVSTAPVPRPRHKPYGGIQMEGPLARWYASITRGRRDYPITARHLAARLQPGASVLEVAPGPGYLALELARLGQFRLTGLDISRSFVRIATDNARRAGLDVDFRQGDVASMPFADNSFDLIVCQAAFKNFAQPVAALDEMFRVLRPGGTASIFDLRKDAPPEAIDREVASMHLPAPSALLTRWIFRFGLLRAAYSRESLDRVVAASRFRSGDITPDGIGFELHLTKPNA